MPAAPMGRLRWGFVHFRAATIPRPRGDPLTEVARDLGLEEAKESIAARGRERGFVTSDDLLEAVPVDDFTPVQVEEFLTQVEEHLRNEGIEVIEVPGDDLVEPGVAARLDVDLLKATPGSTRSSPGTSMTS